MKRNNFFSVLILILLLAIILFARIRITDYSILWNDKISAELLTKDGQKSEVSLRHLPAVHKGDQIRLSVQLPEKDKVRDAVLSFMVEYSAVTASFQGQEFYARDMDRVEHGKYIGRVFNQIEIPETAWGSEIIIELKICENLAFSTVGSFLLYPSQKALYYYFENNLVSPLIAFGILGIICILFLFINTKGFSGVSTNFVYICCYALFSCVWIFCRYGTYNLISHSPAFYWIDNLVFSIILLPIDELFARNAESKNHKKALRGSLFFSLFCAFLCAFLNDFTSIHYSSTIYLLIFTSVINLCVMWICIHNRKNLPSQILQRKGFIILGISVLLNLLFDLGVRFTWLPGNADIPSFLPGGLFALLLYLIAANISDLYLLKVKNIVLSETVEQLKKNLNEIPSGVCVFNISDCFKIVDANEFFYNLFGYTKSEAELAGFGSLQFSLSDNGTQKLVDSLKHGMPNDRAFLSFDVDAKDRLGNSLTLLGRFRRTTFSRDLWLLSADDISERVRMREETERMLLEYQKTLELANMNFFTFFTKEERAVRYFNRPLLNGKAEMFDVPNSLISGGHVDEQSQADLLQAFADINNGSAAGRFLGKYRHAGSDEFRDYLLRYSTIFNQQGEPVSAVFLTQDITELKKREVAYSVLDNILSSSDDLYNNNLEFNLTSGECSFSELWPDENGSRKEYHTTWDGMLHYFREEAVYAPDADKFCSFMSRNKLISDYYDGLVNQEFYLRFNDINRQPIWNHMTILLYEDPYSHDLKTLLHCKILHGSEAREIEEKITAQERSELIEKTRRLYADIESSALYGICEFLNDSKKTLIYANEYFYRLHGFDTAQQALDAGFTCLTKTAKDSDYSAVIAGKLARIAMRPGEPDEFEVTLTNRQGKQIWMLTRIVFNPTSQHFMASGLDITYLKEVEEELSITLQMFEKLQIFSGRHFFFVDIPKRLKYLSADVSLFFGLPHEIPADPQFQLDKGFFAKETAATYIEFYEKIFRGEPSGQAEVLMSTAEAPDNHYWEELSFVTIFNQKHEPQRAIVTYRSIQEEVQEKLNLEYKIRNLQDKLESNRIKLLIKQMQPHFLYNSLSSIREIIKTNPDYAYDLLYFFSTYLRANVQVLSNDDPISFNDELNNIKAYLEIEKMRFGEKLSINYDIEANTFDVLPLSIQPIVENAVRHGIYKRGKAGGKLFIRSRDEEAGHVIEVEDDGVGFDTRILTEKNAHSTDSVGLSNLIFRLKTILGAEITVESTPNVGTLVSIIIPYEE